MSRIISYSLFNGAGPFDIKKFSRQFKLTIPRNAKIVSVIATHFGNEYSIDANVIVKEESEEKVEKQIALVFSEDEIPDPFLCWNFCNSFLILFFEGAKQGCCTCHAFVRVT